MWGSVLSSNCIWIRDSLDIQWLGLCTSIAEGPGSIPHQGPEISIAAAKKQKWNQGIETIFKNTMLVLLGNVHLCASFRKYLESLDDMILWHVLLIVVLWILASKESLLLFLISFLEQLE